MIRTSGRSTGKSLVARKVFQKGCFVAIGMLTAFFNGCGGGGSGEPPEPGTRLSGLVANGPLAGATVRILARDGVLLGETRTAPDGSFELNGLSAAREYQVVASGGTLYGNPYEATLRNWCEAGGSCGVTPWTTVLALLVEEYGYSPREARAFLTDRLGFEDDPFLGAVPVEQFDLEAARTAIDGGRNLDSWMVSFLAWALAPGNSPPPGVPSPEPEPEPEPVTFLVSTRAGSGGTTSPSEQVVPPGGTASFTITPAAGHRVAEVTGCNGALNGSTFTTGAVTGDCTVTAGFALVSYLVDAHAGQGGVISPSSREVLHGGTAEFSLQADPGYRLQDASGCNGALDGSTFVTGVVTGGCTVTAGFTLESYRVDAKAGRGGVISPSSREVLHGGTAEFTVQADPGFRVQSASGCGGTLSGSTYTTGAVTGDCAITADFTPISYPVRAEAGGGGSISPSSQEVLHGAAAEFTLRADPGYHLYGASGCGGSLQGSIYTTGAITGACTVSATFRPDSPVPAEDLIVDNGADGTKATGEWTQAAAPFPYGAGSLTSRETGATYSFETPAAGRYDLFLWWTQAPDRRTTVPVEIYNSGVLIRKVLVNQQLHGGHWNWLGAFDFSGQARIVVVSQDSAGITCADAVRLVRIADVGPRVTITSPPSHHLQTSNELTVRSETHRLEAGWGVRFLLDGGRSIDGRQPPYEAVFSGVARGEHTIDALVIDGQGREVEGPDARSRAVRVGIGDYYVAMGDSITSGVGDNIAFDNLSQDGRDRSAGYPPVLNDLLTGRRKIPHRLANEGVGGTRSVDGKNAVRSLLGKHPEAQIFLVQYGTNDSTAWATVPSGLGLRPGDQGYRGSYKDHLQQIIDAVHGAGKRVYLAKVPIALGEWSGSSPYPAPETATRNQVIREYNRVVEELVLANRIAVPPPDFYGYFTGVNPATGKYRYQEEFADNLHPNGLGYRALARLWEEAIASGP